MHRLVHLLRHGSLPVVVIGVLLPWLRVAGRGRSGVDSAELLVTLADLGVPGGLRWMGVLWYLAAGAVLVGWGASTVTARFSRVAMGALLAGATGWIGFVFIGTVAHSVHLAGIGPSVSLVGCAGLVAAEYLNRTTAAWASPPT